MADVEAVEVNDLGVDEEDSQMAKEVNQEVEGSPDPECDEEEQAENGDRWIDVKDLKNLSLNELKTVGNNDGGRGDADRRLDMPITKVVVRRLPPQITIQDYLQELSEIPGYNYIRLVPPNEDLPSRIGRRSSIYINFDSEQEAFWFKEKYNNMKFFDDRGNSYIACVDFSFIQDFQQDPEPDPQQGTLEESELFTTFLKAYEEEPWSFTMNKPENIPTPEAMLDEILNKKIIEPESTPLLQFLRDRSIKKDLVRRERDQQRRKERDLARRKQKEEILKRKLKEKEEAARRKLKDKDDKRKGNDEGKDLDKDAPREKRRERDRERQRERDKERRLRREKERQEREKNKGNEDPQSTEDKSGQGASSKPKGDKDKDKDKSKPYSGSVTYSKSGNVTRWSENSGPRKNEKSAKEEPKRSQEQVNQTKKSDSSDKLPVEKSSDTSSKSKDSSKAFGKPFPSKQDSNSPNEKKTEAVESKGGEIAESSKRGDEKDAPDKPKKEGEGGPVRKRVVKRIIKVKKAKDQVENSDDIGNEQLSVTSEGKTKKVIRVVKKNAKSEDQPSSKVTDNGGKKAESSEGTTKGDVKSGAEGLKTEGESDKERKGKKGRPEIQIYRPGSLRGASTKPTASASSGDKEKERKSDNGNK